MEQKESSSSRCACLVPFPSPQAFARRTPRIQSASDDGAHATTTSGHLLPWTRDPHAASLHALEGLYGAEPRRCSLGASAHTVDVFDGGDVDEQFLVTFLQRPSPLGECQREKGISSDLCHSCSNPSPLIGLHGAHLPTLPHQMTHVPPGTSSLGGGASVAPWR